MSIELEELHSKVKNKEKLNNEIKRTNERLLATISRIQIDSMEPQSVTELVILTTD